MKKKENLLKVVGYVILFSISLLNSSCFNFPYIYCGGKKLCEKRSAFSNMKIFPLMKKKQKNVTDTIPEVQWEINTFHNKTHHLLKSWKKITEEKITQVIPKQMNHHSTSYTRCHMQHTKTQTQMHASLIRLTSWLFLGGKRFITFLYHLSLTIQNTTKE